MLMAAGLDTGDILLVSETPIAPEETAGELFDRLAALCPDLLIRTLDGLAAGEITPVKQDEEKATYVGMLTKEMSVIDWSKDAAVIHDMIRGMNPWPVAKTMLDGKLFKIYSSAVTAEKKHGGAGEMYISDHSLFVLCGDGKALRLGEVQLEGAKRMSAADFIRGHAFEGVKKLSSEG